LADGSFVRPFIQILSDATPFVVGTILAAGFDPMSRKVQMIEYLGPYHVLFMSNYLISHIHMLLVVLGYTWRSPVPVPLTIVAHFLLGGLHSLSLTTVILLCGRSATKLGVVYGMVALGVLLRMATAAISTSSHTDIKQQQHGVVWALAMLTVLLLWLFNRPKDKPKPNHPAEASATERPFPAPVACLQQEKTPSLTPATTTPASDGYPPPASRSTIFSALFSFAYHALVTALPACVVFLSPPTSDALPTSLTTPALVFWASLAIGRFTLSPRGEDIPRAKLKRLVYGALVLAGVLLFLPALYFSVNSVDTLAAVACAGGVLGPVYPSVVAVAHHGMGERERLAGMGAVVAFGSAGAVAGLVVSQLVTRFSGMTVVLHLVFVGVLVGGMLLCCKGLLDEARSVEEKAVA
jgi:hypothetical protein